MKPQYITFVSGSGSYTNLNAAMDIAQKQAGIQGFYFRMASKITKAPFSPVPMPEFIEKYHAPNHSGVKSVIFLGFNGEVRARDTVISSVAYITTPDWGYIEHCHSFISPIDKIEALVTKIVTKSYERELHGVSPNPVLHSKVYKSTSERPYTWLIHGVMIIGEAEEDEINDSPLSWVL